MNNVDICKFFLSIFWGGGFLNLGGGFLNFLGGGLNCWGVDLGGRFWRGWVFGIGLSCCWNNELEYDYRYILIRCMIIVFWLNFFMVVYLKLFWL